jgi:hypothetical protein
VAAASIVSWARRIGYCAPTIIIADGSPALRARAGTQTRHVLQQV